MVAVGWNNYFSPHICNVPYYAGLMVNVFNSAACSTFIAKLTSLEIACKERFDYSSARFKCEVVLRAYYKYNYQVKYRSTLPKDYSILIISALPCLFFSIIILIDKMLNAGSGNCLDNWTWWMESVYKTRNISWCWEVNVRLEVSDLSRKNSASSSCETKLGFWIITIKTVKCHRNPKK